MDNQNSKFFFTITSKSYKKIVGDCLGFLFDKKEDSEKLKKYIR